MPKITNRLALPQPIVEAVKNDPYDKGDADFSATELVKPSLMVRLMQQYDEEIEVDVIDRIWALRGQALHYILERANRENSGYVVEKRFFADNGSVKISGQADVYYPELCLLQDWKDTSVFSVKNGRPKDDWIKQLNILAYLARYNGVKISRLEAVPFLKDWRPSERLSKGREYPPEKVLVMGIPIWSVAQQREYIQERIASHQRALDAKTLREIPPCSIDERWERATKWAVMTEGKKRALKLWSTKEEAVTAAESNTGKYKGRLYVECRPGARVRCEGYCEVAKFCPDYVRFLREGK